MNLTLSNRKQLIYYICVWFQSPEFTMFVLTSHGVIKQLTASYLNPTAMKYTLIGFIQSKKTETVYNGHNLIQAIFTKFGLYLLPLSSGKVLRGQYKSYWKAEKSDTSTRKGCQSIHFLLYQLFVTFESGSSYLTSLSCTCLTNPLHQTTITLTIIGNTFSLEENSP